MASTGRGDYPLNSAWFLRRRSRGLNLPRKPIIATTEQAQNAVFTDWAFDAATGGAVSGSLASTLGTLALAATEKTTTQASLNSTLASLTQTASGIVSSGAISGSANVTLGAVTLAATEKTKTNSTLGETLSALTLASQAGVRIQATSSTALSALTVASTGAAPVKATLTSTLASLSMTGSVTGTNHGAVNVALGALTLAAIGTLPITATTGGQLAALTMSASATVTAASGGGSGRFPNKSKRRKAPKPDFEEEAGVPVVIETPALPPIQPAPVIGKVRKSKPARPVIFADLPIPAMLKAAEEAAEYDLQREEEELMFILAIAA